MNEPKAQSNEMRFLRSHVSVVRYKLKRFDIFTYYTNKLHIPFQWLDSYEFLLEDKQCIKGLDVRL